MKLSLYKEANRNLNSEVAVSVTVFVKRRGWH